MAVLQKIRDKAGLAVSIIIALALLSFIIDPSTLETAMNSMSSKYDVGMIAGKKISYTDFQEDVERFSTINRIVTGSNVQNEQVQQQVRDAAWQSLVDKYLFIKNAKAAGINVGEEEMVNLTKGDNPSPLIASNPVFADESGNFSPSKVVEFVQSLSSDNSGEAKTFWNYLQNSIYTQQYYAKYGALFLASNVQNALQQQEDIADGNTTANVDFVMKPFSMEEDSTIVVSPAAMKKFYNAHKKDFKQNASRDIEYVVFEVVPSVEDKEAARKEFDNSYVEFASADNMKAFLLKNSDKPYSEYWYRKGELGTVSSDIDKFVFESGDAVSPIYTEGNTYRAAKVMKTAMISDSVYVKHILLQGSKAQATADSLLAELKKGADFSVNAAAFSADQQSAADGQIGNIGWMTQTYMIPGFESVITATIGQPYIVKTAYGTHIVVVSKKTAPVMKKQVAILEKEVLASKETFNSYYADANKFATLAGGTINGFEAAADTMKVYAHPQNGVTEATSSFGAIDQAKEVTRWVFDAKKGKCSAIITVNNNYFFIAAVKEIHKEGTIPFKEVEPTIRQKFYSDLMAQKEREAVAKAIEGKNDIQAVAAALGAEVNNVPDMALAVNLNPYMQSNEPALIGAASKLAQGKVSRPVSGRAGTYVICVNSKETGSFFTEEDAKAAATQKAQYASQMIIPVMMEKANVKDNRARFY